MRKFVFLSLLAFIFSHTSYSQDAVKWTFSSNKTGDNEYILEFKADIAEGYYMYSTDKIADGPMPLVFEFMPGSYDLIEKPVADKQSKDKFDDGFGIDVKYYEGTVIFKQKVVLKNGSETIKGQLTFQTCSAETCIPGDADFQFVLEAKPIKKGSNQSVLIFFIIAILTGLANVIMPCVFPMIPMVVSFFMNGAGKAGTITKGLIFGLSVTFLYSLIGIIVAITGNDELGNILATDPIVNFVFFAMFVAFALSFFGLYEINLPTGLANKADKQVDKGGYLASFFLAVVFVIVSFSCTGPFVGSLLMESARGAGMAIKPIAGMLGFGFGLSLPFMIFAFVPSLIKKLPKSGGWLNAVKVSFAFLLAAFSLKYLDVVDTAMKWNIITRDVFLVIWIVLFVLLGIYLLGKIRLSHDSPIEYVSFPRLLFAISSFVFALYLLPGLFGAPLANVSALIPSQEKQVFDLTRSKNNIQPKLATNTDKGTLPLINIETMDMGNGVKYSDFLSLPTGMNGYFDLKEGYDAAKKQNKPVLLDFKGHFCGNCKKMDKEVFADKRVIDLLNSKFIVIGLYTDDDTILPDNEHVTLTNGRVLKTIGAVNKEYQKDKYMTNGQPYFVVTDANSNALSDGVGYMSSPDKFLDWLNNSIK